MPTSDEQEEVQKLLRDALVDMPGIIESALSAPKVSATNTLRWVEIATRFLEDPVGRAVTDIDVENRRKAAKILKSAVPALEKIRDEHRSERLSKTATKYLQIIASKVS
jgi:hypothetical protein